MSAILMEICVQSCIAAQLRCNVASRSHELWLCIHGICLPGPSIRGVLISCSEIVYLSTVAVRLPCDLPVPADYGTFYPTKHTFLDGESTTMMCNSGMKLLNGNGVLTCRNSSWLGSYPICVVKGERSSSAQTVLYEGMK